MAIQGGVIFACVAAYFFLKKKNIPILPFADIVTPAIILGQSVGRIANFMNGDAFGHPTGLGYGILYPATTLAYKTYGPQPLWPAEVWECQGDLIIFCLLIWYSCFKHPKGTTFCLYIMLYSLLRFFLEFSAEITEPMHWISKVRKSLLLSDSSLQQPFSFTSISKTVSLKNLRPIDYIKNSSASVMQRRAVFLCLNVRH